MPATETWVLAALLPLGRVGPLLLAAPFAGILGRFLLLFATVALLGPALLPASTAALPGSDFSAFLPLFFHELGVGLILLVGAALPWAALRGAGRLLDSVSAQAAARSGPVEELCGLLALCLFFAMGGATLLVSALAKSYAVAPLTPSLAGLAPDKLIAISGRLIGLSFYLALPVISARLVAELGLGLLFRDGRFSLGAGLASGAFSPLFAARTAIELVTLVAGIAAVFFSWHSSLGLAGFSGFLPL